MALNFSKFLENITLTQNQWDDAQTKYEGVCSCLDRHFYDTDYTPEHKYLFGSYKLRTCIRPIVADQDVDVLFKISKATHDKYIDNPGGLLQEVRLALKSKYTTTDKIKAWGKVVLVNFADGTIWDTTPKRPSVIQYFDEFRREQSISNQWTSGTMECWAAFRKHLLAQVKGNSFDYFNDDGINAFVRYLRVRAKMEEKTVQKHYLNLRWFLNWAVRKGYASEREIGKTQPKFKVIDKPVIFLTKDELLKLYRYEIPANGTKVTLHTYEGEEYEKVVHDATALAKTRDMFCFCAFTSLRYSDMAALKRTDISGDYIYITTQKTNDRLPINLNSFAKEILDKYRDCKFPDATDLPVISNQKMNEYLKEVCELCEFNDPITRVCFRAGQREEETQPKYELIGTHAGRRTFICFALASGIPPQVVMKWTGHSDYKAMKPYIDIAEKVKAEQMAIFENGLKK